MPHQQNQRDKLGCDSMCFGSMNSARSFLSLVGATVIGSVSDLPGFDSLGGTRKICLALGICSTMLGVVLANRASTITGLWLSLIPTLLQQNMSLLKALFSDYHDALESSKAERAGSVGMIGMAAGISMMVGPITGSMVLKTYNRATIGALLCLCLSAICIWQVPSSTKIDGTTETSGHRANPAPEIGVNPHRVKEQPRFWKREYMRSPAALFLMVIRLLSTLSHHIYQTIWTVSTKERLNFQPKDYGLFMSLIGFFFAVSQGFLAKLLLKRLGSTRRGQVRLLTGCILVIGITRALAFQTTKLVHIYLLFAAMVLALGVTTTVFATDTSQIALPAERGSFFGLIQAVESGSGMLGPLLGGALTYWHPINGPLIATLTLNVVTLLMFAVGYERVVLGQVDQHMAESRKTQ